jgi:hypothetical protein
VALLVPLPVLVIGSPVAKVMTAFVVVVLFVGSMDFAFGPRPITFPARVAHIFGFLLLIDTTQIKVLPKRFDGRAAAQIFAGLAAAGVVIVLWPVTEAFLPTLRYILRSIFSAVIVLAFAEMSSGLVRFVSAALGASLPPVHDAPYLSRTVGEFWTRRWNLATGSWLRRHCFSPLKQHGAMFALAGTFAASAALHAYLFMAVDPMIALSWTAFFMVQPPLLLAERRLHVRRWPVALARIWTIGILVLLLPLLLPPFLFAFHTSL